jgi:hypothetical protein
MRNLRRALESELTTLDTQRKAILAALAVIPGAKMARATLTRRPGQRRFTAAQRAEQSRKMKLYWKKRRASA